MKPVNVPRVGEITRDKDREREEREWREARARILNQKKIARKCGIDDWKRILGNTRSF